MRAACTRRSNLRPGSTRGVPAPRRALVLQRPQCRRSSQSTGFHHFVDSGKLEPSAPPPPLLPDATRFRLAVKDNIATAEFPTQCASRILVGHASPFEATIVQQLRARGATVVGKTNMDEFGMGSYSTNSIHGPVRNPLSASDEEPISAGGSSGGSAVAVMLGDADIALGTDTGGSIRLPASLDAYMNDVFTVPASLAGVPAVSLPAPAAEGRLPIGLQLIGQFWDDRRLLAMAERLKSLMPGTGQGE
ncbi:Amidase signature domain protein [Ophiocordyceps sinensis CO18]|uniref:Amidase signature domain protein n=1 Tax=Ophiocordyceps sinensis (strain Co18 / CGMCC 3.14243) TaxID=911162 RepID=T5AA84_OPHSC|nr:Amidase signature domain protein [Ophiocordyceps sinensis CO18]